MISLIIATLLCLLSIEAAEQTVLASIPEKEFKIYIQLPDGQLHELPYADYQSLMLIDDSIISDTVKQNNTFLDIIIQLPPLFTGMKWQDIENFLKFIMLSYKDEQEPSDVLVVHNIKAYLDQFNVNEDAKIETLIKLGLLADFFNYASVAKIINSLEALLKTVFAEDLMILNSKLSGSETPVEILNQLSFNQLLFYEGQELPEKISKAKIVAYFLRYTALLDALGRLEKVLNHLQEKSLSRTGRALKNVQDPRDIANAHLAQSIKELTGLPQPTDDQVLKAYDYLLKFFSKSKLSPQYKRLKKMRNELTKPQN